MSLTKKRVHLYEVKDEITYDEDVDVYTSTSAVTFDDGETLQDKIDNGFVNAEQLGSLEDLETEDKSNLVASLNEINGVVQSNDVMLNSGESEGGYAFAFGREVLDGSWKSVSTLPYTLNSACAIIYNNEIHILGSGNTSPCTQHYKWNGVSWESVSTLPYEFYNGCAVMYNDEIHIMGSSNSSYRTKHYKYNGSNWSDVGTLPFQLGYGCAVVLDGLMHIMGGTNNNKLHYKYDGSTWVSVSTLPYNFQYGDVVALNDEIHILGTNYSSSYYKYHYRFNGSTWSSVSTLPYNFYRGSSIVLNREIHILGTNNSSYYTAHYKYNGSTWNSVSTLPYNFYDGNALLYKGQVYILGSSTGNMNQHYKLNSGTLLSGYVKANTQIYQPNSYSVSDNLTTLEDGLFEVTEDGLIEIMLEE